MKKFIIGMMLLLTLFSCERVEQESPLDVISQLYPNSRIYSDPENRFEYYLVDSTSLKVVELYGSGDEIQKINELIRVK